MDAYDGTPQTLTEYTQKLVMQFLYEQKFSTALEALEQETGVTFDPETMPLAGELLDAIREHIDLIEARKYVNKGKVEPTVLKNPGDGHFCNTEKAVIKGPLGKSNLIAVCCKADGTQVAVGGSDKTVRIIDRTQENKVIFQSTLDSVILSIAWEEKSNVIAVSVMSGNVYLIDPLNPEKQRVLNDHHKYVVCVMFNEDGTLFATASHDHSINLYKKVESGNYELLHSFALLNCAESIIFRDNETLIAAIREDNYLHIFSTVDFTETKVNLNENGDDHISFSVLDISLNPKDNRFILAATDRDRLILIDLETESICRSYYGADNDVYAHPICVWHSSGEYVYETSQDCTVCCWEVSTQRQIAKLSGHTKAVRGMDFCRNELFTVGYDATLRIWGENTE